MLEVTPIDEGWILRHDGAALPATVPGCVHTDLLAAGIIPDPFLGRNETDVAWVGRRDWTYETTLTPIPGGHEQTDLVFDGLDTAAEIRLDGQLLGSVRNMHRSHRFDITGLSGRLSVNFRSAYGEAEAVRGRLGERPNAYPEPFQYIRKMACSFGWDWGPTLVTAGIWKRVRLEHWSTARIARVRPVVTVEQGVGCVELYVDVERTRVEAGLTLGARIGGVRAEATVDGTSGVVRLEVPDVELWWPRGYGEQPLYDVELWLSHEGLLDIWRRRIGFRSVELDRGADEHGSGFTFVVNGERLFARGVNWIPDDVLPSRITRERYRTRLTQAADAGVDLVRVWGGGIYESEDFYDACDELGLLVWQDFPFACAAYPEEQPLRGEVEAEARENVVRLMPHPSLVLWNGNNENLWGFKDWGWEQRLAGDSWGEGYYLGLLPRVVAELDPTRPYTPGSPGPAPGTVTPTTRHTARITRGRCGTGRTTRTTGSMSRVSWPSSAGRHRPRTPPCDAPCPTRNSRPTPPACCTTRRPTTATASWCAGSPATSPCPNRASPKATSTGGTTSPRSTRPGPSPPGSSTGARTGRCARARSCGSSTTAGR